MTGVLPDKAHPVLLGKMKYLRIPLGVTPQPIRVQENRAVGKRAPLQHLFMETPNRKLDETERISTFQHITIQEQVQLGSVGKLVQAFPIGLFALPFAA